VSEVRFGPKTDLIPKLNPVAHASRLCNRAEEYRHAGSSECAPASAVEQGKADGDKATAATDHFKAAIKELLPRAARRERIPFVPYTAV
jgi:hypothetical protein